MAIKRTSLHQATEATTANVEDIMASSSFDFQPKKLLTDAKFQESFKLKDIIESVSYSVLSDAKARHQRGG